MTDPKDYPTLHGSDWELENDDQDIRGRTLLDAGGARLGVIKDMLVDPDDERVAAVRLDNGEIIPIEALTIGPREVVARPPGRPAAESRTAAEPRRGAGEEVRVPIVEEHIRVGKRQVDRGGVSVSTNVVEEPVNQRVVLHSEKVSVERRPVNAATDPKQTDALFEERSFEATEHSEEPVVAKEAVVKEEVVVRTEETEDVVDIDDTVRRTEVNVDDDRQRRTPPPR